MQKIVVQSITKNIFLKKGKYCLKEIGLVERRKNMSTDLKSRNNFLEILNYVLKELEKRDNIRDRSKKK
jgi:hypothetical protein